MGDNLWCRLSLLSDPIDSIRHRGMVLSRDPEVLSLGTTPLIQKCHHW